MTTQPTTSTTGDPAGTRRGEPLLEIKDLAVYYGNIAAVQGLTLDVRKGEIVTVVGSNGAGKSTTLRTISGLMQARRGSITFKGDKISGKPGNEIVKRGICQSPEGRRIFPRMTVDENLDLGAFLRNDKAAVAATREHVLDLFPRLRRAHQPEGRHHVRRRAADARSRPGDDGQPKAAAARRAVDGAGPGARGPDLRHHREDPREGTTVLLVEQNALAALRVADYAYVMESGRLKLEGPAASSPRTRASSTPTSAADRAARRPSCARARSKRRI